MVPNKLAFSFRRIGSPSFFDFFFFFSWPVLAVFSQVLSYIVFCVLEMTYTFYWRVWAVFAVIRWSSKAWIFIQLKQVILLHLLLIFFYIFIHRKQPSWFCSSFSVWYAESSEQCLTVSDFQYCTESLWTVETVKWLMNPCWPGGKMKWSSSSSKGLIIDNSVSYQFITLPVFEGCPCDVLYLPFLFLYPLWIT